MRTLMVAAIMAATVIGSGAALAVEKAPEAGTWEYRVALETGSLPAPDSAKAQKESGRQDASVATVEAGGVVFRVGIDTN